MKDYRVKAVRGNNAQIWKRRVALNVDNFSSSHAALGVEKADRWRNALFLIVGETSTRNNIFRVLENDTIAN